MAPIRRVVLVGGGHAHVGVIRSWAKAPPAGAELLVVSDGDAFIYSGMLPGFVAGEYSLAEISIPLAPLAARAGGRFLSHRALRVDPRARRIEIDGGPDLSYDVASLDVGSDVAGMGGPGVAQNALATRPVGRLAREIAPALARARADGNALRVVVVGAGAAGLELGFALGARIAGATGVAPRIAIYDAGDSLLPGPATSLARRIARRCAAAGISFEPNRRAVSAEPGRLQFEDGRDAGFDLLLWATGAAPPAILARSALPADERGFARVRSTLQVEGFDDLFAAGDAAALIDHPETPRAGVYAVRAAPVLAHNLGAVLAGRPLRVFRPQRDFLVLLNLADGTAAGAKWGVSFEGRWVRRWKDRIDRHFVDGFGEPDQSSAA